MDESTSTPSGMRSRATRRSRPGRTGLPKRGRRGGAQHGVDPATQHLTRELDPVTRTRGSGHSDLTTFVDRVIVPALVERFLSEHTDRRPDGDTPLATPTDVA